MNIIKFIGDNYLLCKKIYNIIGIILTYMLAYKSLYVIVGLLFTRKFKSAKKKHKYAIVIAARNEEAVIGNLLDSINKQDYPKNLLTTFVVADNCTDNTAKIARKYGAVCYERFDEDHRTKGYALQYLFENIKKDYKIDSFEGYFIFDADNLLKKDYISKMNNAFDSGEKIITSYRNTKNFDENWISSTYALHWLRSIRFNHRARSVFHLATNIQGTGFLFASEIVKDGWKYTGLTEDRALTADAVSMGYQITYQDEAEFYDEQPTSIKVALRQRLRWSKGHLQAFVETGPKLLKNIIFGSKKHTHWESLRIRIASYDTLMQLTPLTIFNLLRWLLVCVFIYGCYSFNTGLSSYLFGGSTIVAKLLTFIFNKPLVQIKPGIKAFVISMLLAIFHRILYRLGMYIENMWAALYVFIVEHKRIKKISIWKKILYIFTWPTFDIIGRYTTYAALFTKSLSWKPIPHTSKITIDNLQV